MLAGYQADQCIVTSCSTAAQQHGADSGRVEGLIPTCSVMYLWQRRVQFLKLASGITSHNLTINYDLQHRRHTVEEEEVAPDLKCQPVSVCLQPSAAADSRDRMV